MGNHVGVCVAGGGSAARKYSGRLSLVGTPADTRKRGDERAGWEGELTTDGDGRDTRHDCPAATKGNFGEPMGDETGGDTQSRDDCEKGRSEELEEFGG
jgi:hypothetical protein